MFISLINPLKKNIFRFRNAFKKRIFVKIAVKQAETKRRFVE